MNIPNTKIGTSEPLNICSGIAYFPGPGDPSGQTHRGYPTGLQPEWVIWDCRAKLWWGGGDDDFVTKAVARIEIGVCGPNYAIKSTFSGTADQSGMALSVASDEIAAGFFFGFGMSFTPSMSIFGVGLTLPAVTLDVLRLITEYFWGSQSPQKGALGQVDRFTPSLSRTTGYSMFDANQNAFVSNKGKYKASPTFNIAVDLVSVIPQLSALNKSINEGLKWLGLNFRITFGPTLGIQLPVSIDVESVELDGARYANVTYNESTKKITAGAPSGQLPSSPGSLRISFRHTPSLTFSVGVSWGLGIEKVFFLGAQISFPVGQWLGLSARLGTWSNPLQNSVGGSGLSVISAAEDGDSAEYAEVIFETAGPAV